MGNRIKCPRCGAMNEVRASNCAYCGEYLGEYTEQLPDNTYKIPRTIEELKQFYEDKGVPVRNMRFFIGEDYKEPRAFGIYKNEDGQFVVYKNKDTGDRAIRYCGTDEAYAVREIYEKVKSEIDLRRNSGSRNHVSSYSSVPYYNPDDTYKKRRHRRSPESTVFYMVFAALALYIVLQVVTLMGGNYIQNNSHRGYYNYDNTYYYHISDDWYYYDPYEEVWLITGTPDFYSYDYGSDYYTGSYYSSNDYYTDWEDSEWYDDYNYESSRGSSWESDSSSDWYDDYDYDSGSSWDSWDSSSTDWGSDW